MQHKNRYRFDKKNHVHLLDDRPLVGTSSAMSVIKPPLAYWASGLAVQAFGCPDAKLLTRLKNGKATEDEKATLRSAAARWCLVNVDSNNSFLTVDGLMALWSKAYTAHATTLKTKAVEGTDLHAELERFVRDEMAACCNDAKSTNDAYNEHIWPFIEWSRANVRQYLFSEAHCYSEKHWIGGICDAGAILNDGTAGVIDFKSAKDAYLNAHWQAAGYAIQIDENGIFDANGAHSFLPYPEEGFEQFNWTAIVPFGAQDITPRFHVNVERSKEMFLACLKIYNELPK